MMGLQMSQSRIRGLRNQSRNCNRVMARTVSCSTRIVCKYCDTLSFVLNIDVIIVERCKMLQVVVGHGSHVVMANVFLDSTIAMASWTAPMAVTNITAVSAHQYIAQST